MRRAYLALTWPSASTDAAARSDACARRLSEEGVWREVGRAPGIALWTAGDDLPVLALPDQAGFIVGDVIANDGRPPAELLATLRGMESPAQLARALSRTCWGRYVGVLGPTAVRAAAAFRDPGGMLGALTWSLGDGLEAVASDFDGPPGWLGPRRGHLDWDRIAEFLAAPAAAMAAPLIEDVRLVHPGELAHLGRPGRVEVIWSVTDFVANRDQDLRAAGSELVRRVEACTAALTARYDRVLMELSGGLDSSILAGALGATGMSGRVVEWLNYQDDRPEADESRFARAVAQRLGVALTTPRDWAVPVDEDSLREIGRCSWPAIGGVDVGRDRDELARLRRTGASGIISGQGGDGVFFQYPTALVIADELKRHGLRSLVSPMLPEVARRTRQSVWGVLGEVLASTQGRAQTPKLKSTLLSPGAAAATRHAEHRWVTAARDAGAPPAKVLHVQAIAVTHLYRGASRRLKEADIILPLFAQPVIEHGLSIAAPDLAGGSYDRPFARRAFAEHLPREVVERRSKGDMSTYYAKLVAISLGTLRPYLLDGCLAEAGLLDRTRLDQTLDAQALLSGGGGAAMDVMNAAAVEAWVRYWQTRVPDSLTAGRFAAAA